VEPSVSTAGDTITWLTDSAHWHGVDGVPHRLAEHLAVSGLSLAFACRSLSRSAMSAAAGLPRSTCPTPPAPYPRSAC
jgi:hypothetical protein